jgi:cbb3-type cytochrome oxidase maturation protein
MAILLLFTAVALALFTLGVLALAWAVRSGQLDDLETPALRLLTDDPPNDHADARPR